MFNVRTLLLMPLYLAGLLAHAQRGGDLQAQILYAFHAEDSNQLLGLVQTLSTRVQADGADDTLRYHLAHARYREGLLAGERRAQEAESAFAACVVQLKEVLARDVGSVESLALQSACYSNLARYDKLAAVLLRSRAAQRLRNAYEIAPRNPRVVLLMASEGLARSKIGSEENTRAFERLQLAAQLFDRSSGTATDAPGWGHAEAYLELGRQFQLRGDGLGARNWIEKSLLSAPDFKAARRQLATLARP